MGLFKKKGGGFLNGVTGVIIGYRFDAKVWGEGEDAYTTLSAELNIQQDGATEAVKTFVPAGFIYEGTSVSEDGRTLVNEENGDPIIQENTEWARLVTSLVAAGFPEESFDPTGRNYEAMLGARVTFEKKLDEENQIAIGAKKLGKAKAATASREKLLAAGRRQDKNDKKKSYNRDYLVVSAYHGQVEVETGATKAAKGAAKKAAPAKAATKPAAPEQDFGAAEGALLSILADAKDNTVQRTQLSSLVVKYALANNIPSAEREALRKTLTDTAFIERNNGWASDAKTVTLA